MIGDMLKNFFVWWLILLIGRPANSQPAYLFPSTSGLGTSISNYEGPAFLSSSPSNYQDPQRTFHTADTLPLGKKPVGDKAAGSSGGSKEAAPPPPPAPAAAETDDFVFKPSGYVPIPSHPVGWGDKWGRGRGMGQFYGPAMGQYRALSQEEMLDQLLHEQRYDKRERPVVSAASQSCPSCRRGQAALQVNFTITATSLTLAYQQPNGYSITAFDVDVEIGQQWYDSRLTFRVPRMSSKAHAAASDLNAFHHYKDIWQPDICAIDRAGRFLRPSLQVQQKLVISANGSVNYLQRRSYRLECTGNEETFPFDRRFCELSFESVESDRNALWLLLQDQVGAMTRSLDLNHPIITDIWMTECSKKHRVDYSCLMIRLELKRRDMSLLWMTIFAPDILLVSLCSLTFWQEVKSGPTTARLALAIGTFIAHYVEQRPATYALNLWSLVTLGFLFLAALESVFVLKLHDIKNNRVTRPTGGPARSGRSNSSRSAVAQIPNRRKSYYHNNRFSQCVMTHPEDDQCRRTRAEDDRSCANEVRQQTLSTSTSVNVVNSLTADERRLAQQQAAGGSSRIYRELETGYSSGSSRAGSTGGPGAVARPATLDFTDIGEEAAYSDDNLCEEQPMGNLSNMTPTNEYFHLNEVRHVKSKKHLSTELSIPIDNLFKLMFPACYLLFLISYFSKFLDN